MNLKIFSKGAVLSAAGLLALSITTADLHANLKGRWISHPAAALRSQFKESQIDRIIDGNRYVYFSVRGGAFNKDNPYTFSSVNKIEPLTLFRYDKSGKWEDGCIVPLAKDMRQSGYFHNILEYSPRLGLLAVVYDNNAIDFIGDNGSVVASKALQDLTVPLETATPYSITFDSELPQVYIAGSFGVATVNTLTGELVECVGFDKPVAWAARVGDRMVVVAGDIDIASFKYGEWVTPVQPVYSADTYIYPVGSAPKKLASPVTGGENIQALMPLSANSFAALSPGTADTRNKIRFFRIAEDGSVVNADITGDLTTDNASAKQYRHLFRTDGMVSQTDKGYAVSSQASIILLEKGEVADVSPEVYKNSGMTTISKSALGTNEKNSKVSSVDGKTVWFAYYDTSGLDGTKRGFYSRPLSDGAWGPSSDVVTPLGPTSSFMIYGEYNPKYGMLFRGPGYSHSTGGTSERDNFSAYKDGNWTDLSYSAVNKSYVIPDDHSKYIATDPLNPDWIWYDMPTKGFVRADLSDFNNFFGLGCLNNSSLDNYPGFFRVFPEEYGNWVITSNPSFDSGNRLWFAQYSTKGSDSAYWNYEDLIKGYVRLFYYTPEEREAIANIGADASQLIKPHCITIMGTEGYHNSHLEALKSEKNKNIIAYSVDHFPEPKHRAFFFDHNGTPEDQSDDRIVFLDRVVDERGVEILFNRERGFFEDLKTGDLWYSTSTGSVIIDPVAYMDGNKSSRRPHITRRYGQPADDYPFEQVEVTGIANDPQGRLWVASTMGLYCLSADREELLAFYNTENSPLPDDMVSGVVIDEASGAVFALTNRGMVEFQPEDSNVEIPSGTHLTVWPAAVTPDYKGYVNISGAQNGAVYEVRDKDGALVSTVGSTLTGEIQWLPSGLKSGRYTITRKGYQEENTFIVLE